MESCTNVDNSEESSDSDWRAAPAALSENYANQNKYCFILFAKAIMVRLPDIIFD